MQSQVRTASLTEELPYWELVDGMVVLSDGRVEVGLEITPPPAALRSTEQLEAMLHPLKSLLRGMPEGERLRVIIEAAPMAEERLLAYRELTQTPNERLAYMAEERYHTLEQLRRRGELLTWRGYVTVTLSRWRRRRPWTAWTREELEELRAEGARLRGRMASFLEAAGYAPRALADQETFEAIWRYLNPGLAATPPRYVAAREYYPDSVLREVPELTPRTLRWQLVASTVRNEALGYLAVGDRLVRVAVAAGMPDYTTFGATGRLLETGGHLYLVVDMVHSRYEEALKRLKARARRFASTASDTSLAYVDPNVRVGLVETDQALQHLSMTGDHVYEVGMAVVLIGRGETELEDRTARLQSVLAQAFPGSRLYPLTFGGLQAWLELAPYGGRVQSRRLVMVETNAAHYIPAQGPWKGSSTPVAAFLNRYGDVTFLDPFDRKAANWNAIVVGGSGSGKTFFMQSLLAELLRQDADVIIVDRGFGYAPFVELVGGAVVPIGPGAGVSINPFDLPPGELEPDDDKVAFLVALVKAMIASDEDSRLEDAILQAAVRQTYTRKRTERRVNGQIVRTLEPVFLSDLVHVLATLEEINDRPASAEDRAVAERIATRLQGWVGASVYGSLLDRPTSVMPEASVIYYETSALESQPELEPVMLLLIANMVWQRVKRDPQRRKIVVFDEAWAMLRRPSSAAFIVELYRRFRRYNAAAYSVTQSLNDFRTEITRGILQNTSFYFLLPLPGEDDVVQEVLGLSDRGMALFRSLRPKREVLAWVRGMHGLEGDVLVTQSSPLAYWAFTTDARDMARRQALAEKYGGDLMRAIYELAYPQARG